MLPYHDNTVTENPMTSPLIVFSHLRWDFVYQRPQHLLSRIAHRHRVIFIEEPVHEEGATPRFDARTPCDNVTVLRPVTAVQAGGFHDDQLAVLKPLVLQLLHDEGLEDYLVWFYTPMALPLLAELQPRAVIYDCMDELAAFKGAPLQMRQRESALLKRADLVLTGGPSLYQGKREANPHVYCLPSSVDAAHYAPDRITQHCEEYLAAEKLQGHILAPRIGFFGVIDERLDLGLVAALAESRPDWHIVMVGPVVKIDREALPRQENIHWLGQQPYSRLPALVAGWDVCILPFALNEHTRFISPTKTLEYLAAEKPVVSTPVNDVVSMYGDVVRIAASHEEFVKACADALAETPQQRAERLVQSASTVSRFSWDESARTVVRLMDEAVARAAEAPHTGEAALPAETTDGVVEPLPLGSDTGGAPRAVKHLVIGAGPAGLAAAHALAEQGEHDLLLIEREDRIGGNFRSFERDGYTFDHAPAVLFGHDTQLQALYAQMLGANQHWQTCKAAVALGGELLPHPVERALHELPLALRQASLVDLIQARISAQERSNPERLDDFVRQTWGETLATQAVLPYQAKLWGLPPSQLDASWLAARWRPVPLAEAIAGALARQPLPALRIGHPLQGGLQALMNAFLLHIHGELALNTTLVKLSPQQRTVRLDDGRTIRYDTLISTMPLPALVAACGDEAPPPVVAAARALRHVSLRCVHLGLAREHITDWHWIHCPGDTVFHRLVAQSNLSPQAGARGGFGLTAEISYSADKPLPCEGEALVERVLADARRIGVLQGGEPVAVAQQVDVPIAYPVCDAERAAHVALIRDWLAQHGILLAGRMGEWASYRAEDAFLAGRRAAQQALGSAGHGAASRDVHAAHHAAQGEAPLRRAAGGGTGSGLLLDR
jgi:protoporphyrinogen oxidase/glycosyltransferase involved in cell wall biosynthesis